MAQSSFRQVRLSGLSVVVPDYPRHIDDDLEEFFEGSPSKLARAKKQVGFGTRYVAPEGCTTVDLCEAAARRLLADMGVKAEDLDAVVFAVQRPDYINPGSGASIHRRLGLPKSCVFVDLNHGCPGFIYALWLAAALTASGAGRRTLVLAGDCYPRLPAMEETKSRSAARLMFGDGGAAALVERDPAAPPMFFDLGADGRNMEALIVPAGGARLPIGRDIAGLTFADRQGQPYHLTLNHMDAMAVFNFSVQEPPASLKALLAYAGTALEEVDFVAIHQANKQIVDSVAAKAGLKPHQYSTATFTAYGNQSTASVPAVAAHLLAEKISRGRLKVALCGFGVGLAWGSCLLELDHIYCSGVLKLKFDGLRGRAEEIAYWVKAIGGDNEPG